MKGEYGYDSWVDLCAKGKAKARGFEIGEPTGVRPAFVRLANHHHSPLLLARKSESNKAVIVLAGMVAGIKIIM